MYLYNSINVKINTYNNMYLLKINCKKQRIVSVDILSTVNVVVKLFIYFCILKYIKYFRINNI